MQRLGPGEEFPNITLSLASGGEITLPADVATPYQVVLFYRGHW